MAISCVDWRRADTDRMAALYAAETRRWADTLGWDCAATWPQVELGRQLGTVHGLLALDASGTFVGWTFYLVHQAVLQVGGFVAASHAATVALLDGVFASNAAASAHSATFFAFADAPGLNAALGERGLLVEDYNYLVKPLSDPWPRSAAGLRRWRTDDCGATAALLAAAYPATDDARPFVPFGGAERWREYVAQIVQTSGCGTLMPDSCFVVPTGDRFAGVILVTRLAAATAHIAQIAVDPGSQRRGLGPLLLDAACGGAAAAGCERLTLLVGRRNDRARRLYAAQGFVATARFVSAGGCQPRRLTSVAAGGAMS